MQIISKEVKYTYDKKSSFKSDALNGITLNVNAGDFFGIIGHTGSGKSTFVQHLNALILLQEGDLTVGQYDLKELRSKKKNSRAERKKLRKDVGMVFQYPEYQLFAETVEKDVEFGLKNFSDEKLTDEEIKEKVKSAIESVGLNYEEVREKSPFDLSGGQKRRVAIAGVLVSSPKVLVMDEPVAGLDPVGKQELMVMLHSLHGKVVETIVIISHDMDDIAENCNRVAVFAGGMVVLLGESREVFKNADVLLGMGLDVPIGIRLARALRANGIDIAQDYFDSNDFVDEIAKRIKG